MSVDRVLVTVAGVAAIALVYWYFFRAAAGGSASVAVGRRIRIEVKGGYDPALIRVRAGEPVTLEFHRSETNSCTEEVVLPDFGIRTFLPAHRTTPVTITPAPGSYEFACGMGMVRGRIVAEPAGKA
jgi:plastocyanin domain-containing protein